MYPSDLMLVKRFQRGNTKAFDYLLVKYQRRIYGIAYNFTHNTDDAFDLTQEVFVRAFIALHSFKRESNFYTWLYRIAQNVCIDYVRKRNRYQVVDLDDNQINAEPKLLAYVRSIEPTKKVESEELKREIANAVTQLRSRQKQAFILRHYEGLTIKEIAKTMECQLGTVKAHLSHANHRLRQLLAPYVEG